MPVYARLQQADAIFLNALAGEGLMQAVSQAFAVYVPITSVGVVGDQRQEGHLIVLRAVRTDDFMTAEHCVLPDRLLASVATRIVNEVSGVVRVAYDLTDKPPGTIEWE